VEVPDFLQPDVAPSGRQNLKNVKGGPERYKQAEEVGRATGVAPEKAIDNLDALQGQADADAQGVLLNNSPILDEWLGGDPFNAGVAQDDIENMSFIERIMHGDRAEVLQRQSLEATFDAMGLPEGSAEARAAAEASRRLAAHGVDDADDVTSAFVEAWRVMRGMADAIVSPESGTIIAGGALAGGAAGAVTATPFGVGAGAVTGGSLGLGAAFAMDSFTLETADAYNSLTDAGMDRQAATLPAYIIGGLAGMLEMGGVGLVSKPFVSAGKKVFRKQIIEEFTKPEMVQLFTQFAKDYGVAVGGEVTTEVLQELVQIIGQNIEAAKDSDVEAVSMDEAVERVAEIAKRTAKAMVVLGPIGATTNLISTVAETKRVQTDQQKMDSMAAVAENSKVRERDPARFESFVDDVMVKAGREFVWVDGQALIQFARETQQPGIISRLGIDPQALEDGRKFGAGVRIKSSKLLAQVVGDDYEALAPHIRYSESGLSILEAQEEAALGLNEEQNATNTAALPEEADTALVPPDPTDPAAVAAEIAELQMGADAMYKTAEEAGFTEQEFAAYQAKILDKQQARVDELKDQQLKQKEREATKVWQDQLEVERTIAEQELLRTPTYAALNALGDRRISRADINQAFLQSIGKDRTGENAPLPNAQDLDALETFTSQLPKAGKRGTRNIFGPQGRSKATDLNLEKFAHEQGFANGMAMLEDLRSALPFKRAVETKAENAMFAKHGDLNQELQAIEQARENLFKSDQTSILMDELNQLRKAREAKAINRKLLTQQARELLARTPLSASQFARFAAAARRHAKLARRAIRAGDRRVAEAHKFQQILNQEAGIAALKRRTDLNKKMKYLRSMNKKTADGTKGGLPVRYKQAIQHALSKFELAKSRPKGEDNHLVGLSQDEARGLMLTDRMLSNKTVFWGDATMLELDDLHATVKGIEKTGKEADKIVRGKEEKDLADTLEILFDTLALQPKDALLTRKWFNEARRFGRAAGSYVMNADSMLRHMDGFTEFGPWYEAIKGGHDRLYSEVYLPRTEKVNKRITEIFGIIGENEFGKQAPGMEPGVTRNMQLMAALQLGNEEGGIALRNHPLFSTAEKVQALRDSLTEQDVKFLNEITAFLDEFWPEIKSMEETRRNFTPIKVEAIGYDTPGGRVQGGYVPLTYDNMLSIFVDIETFGQAKNLGLFGGHAAAHTARFHTQQRQKNATQPVALDLRLIQSHVGTVLWDLTMGNELQQVFKILHDTRTTETMRDLGYAHYQDALKLWLRDVITGELYSSNWMERGFRYWRQGLTISRLGLNLKTAMLQPLGLVNTAALLGKFNTLQAIRHMANPKMIKWAQEISPVMKARGTQWSVDQQVVQELLNSSPVKKVLGSKGKAFVDGSAFWLIRKMQAFVDLITFFAAYQKGMNDSNNNQTEAVHFAELMVNRTQGSAIFAQRSAAERGSLKMNSQQTEMLRMWTPFMSYFVAKNNVLFERTKKTNWKNLFSIANFVTDVAMMFWLEGVVVAIMAGTDDDELLLAGAQEGFLSLAAGLPFVRAAVSEARGFAPGLVGSTGKDFGQLVTGLEQAMDKGDLEVLTKAGVNLTFQALHLPGASQTNRAIGALNEPGSTKVLELIFGVHK
jgi:hypothetical protein